MQDRSSNKIYITVVHQLNEMIQRDELTSGDRLPSERELSERLKVGRSSVREAFRALELLGLIETRHGEGTFLRDFRDHRLVDLLGMFLIQDSKAQADIGQVKQWIERSCLESFLLLPDEKRMAAVGEWIQDVHQGEWNDVHSLKSRLVQTSGNRLGTKIWHILHEFDRPEQPVVLTMDELLELKAAISRKDREWVESFIIYHNHSQ